MFQGHQLYNRYHTCCVHHHLLCSRTVCHILQREIHRYNLPWLLLSFCWKQCMWGGSIWWVFPVSAMVVFVFNGFSVMHHLYWNRLLRYVQHLWRLIIHEIKKLQVTFTLLQVQKLHIRYSSYMWNGYCLIQCGIFESYQHVNSIWIDYLFCVSWIGKRCQNKPHL